MNERLTIAQWSSDDQPRERLRDLGAEALSDAELLAILIGSGRPGITAVELMKQILSDKQYKKYEEIFDLTVRNTVKINIERITSARKHMTGMMNTKS